MDVKDAALGVVQRYSHIRPGWKFLTLLHIREIVHREHTSLQRRGQFSDQASGLDDIACQVLDICLQLYLYVPDLDHDVADLVAGRCLDSVFVVPDATGQS